MTTTVGYALGRPRPAASRGGDCHVRDLSTDLRFDGPHRFTAPQHCQIDNGLLRLTVGGAGVAPSLTVSVRRGRLAIGDAYEETYTDTYGGSVATPAWLAAGTITIDSPDVDAELVGARIEWMNPETITVRLIAPAIGNAFVTLPRGWRSFAILHGNTVPPFADIERSVTWTASPAPVGTAFLGRVEEVASPAGMDGLHRFVSAIDPVTTDAGAFSAATAATRSARFGAGVGTYLLHDDPAALHRQLGNASRVEQVWREDEVA